MQPAVPPPARAQVPVDVRAVGPARAGARCRGQSGRQVARCSRSRTGLATCSRPGERVDRAAWRFSSRQAAQLAASASGRARSPSDSRARRLLRGVSADGRAGRLVRLLPDHAHRDSDLLAVYRDRRNLSRRVCVFVDLQNSVWVRVL